VEVTNGDVFAIPIFGPLSGILNRILPGSGYSIAHEASADFKVDQGIIHTDDFDADGTLFSMLVMATSIFSMTSSISICG
jgi:hypothetical protein